MSDPSSSSSTDLIDYYSIISCLNSLFSSAFSLCRSSSASVHPFSLPLDWPEFDFQRTQNLKFGHFVTHFIIRSVQTFRVSQPPTQSPQPKRRKREKSIEETEEEKSENLVDSKSPDFSYFDLNATNLKGRWSKFFLSFVARARSNFPALDGVEFSPAPGGFINVKLTESLAKIAFTPANLPPAPAISPVETFTFSSLGRFESIFKEKHGTPRQGSVFPLARGKFTLHSSIDQSSFDGLSEYSHVWLVFVFHESLAAQAGKSLQEIPTKVKPPRLNGAKLGMFATRTPHRINAIGLSLARLDRIEGKTLFLSGIDLIEGTPILDIKPYHPADRVENFAPPEWMRILPEASLNVTFTDSALSQLRSLLSVHQLEYYKDFDEIRESIKQCLQLDPRTQHSKDAHSNGIYGVQLDRIDVCFRIRDPVNQREKRTREDSEEEKSNNKPTAEVFKIVYYAVDAERPKMRTAEWFKKIQEEIQNIENEEKISEK